MATNYKNTLYNNLGGVDFSRSPSLVDKSRSPNCVNMIADSGKNPVKRAGWETVYSLGVEVHNIWFCTINNKEIMLCHAGDRIYKLEDTAVEIKGGVANARGCGFFARDKEKDYFYILTSQEFLRFDGERIAAVCDSAYIPLITITRTPTGGGESYENINLLTGKRKEGFIGNTALIYQLSAKEIVGVERIEKAQADGTKKELVQGTEYTVDIALGKVSFVSAHPTATAGEDNIWITYEKDVEGYKDKILKCTIATQFGMGGENRVFLSGNPKFRAYDYWSEVYAPSYFADLNYSIIGTPQTAVMGYLKLGESLAIIKKSNGQDTTMFLRGGSVNDKNEVLFTVKSGISGIGAVSSGCFAMLNDDPLFLSEEGVFALTSNMIGSEKVVKNRSYNVDARLMSEKNLDKAVACTWNGFYVLSVNGHCYILDSRQVITARQGEMSARYECYYWENVFASCLATQGDSLWFGTENGRVRRFKTKTEDMTKYSDDGKAITAIWQTPYDDDDLPSRFKQLEKKGTLAVLSPYTYSSCKMIYDIDGEEQRIAGEQAFDISSWFEIIDFARFTFSGNDAVKQFYATKKERRYTRLQIILMNDVANEGFGVHSIIKSYTVKGYGKNRI